MYKVNDKTFTRFLEATKYASSANADVIEIETGLCRWTPAKPVSSKRMRQYHEHREAYAAQQRTA